MKKNILSVLLVLFVVSFSTTMMAQNTSAKKKAKTSTTTPNVKFVPPPPKEERLAPPPPPEPQMSQEIRQTPVAEIRQQEPPMSIEEAREIKEDEVFQVVEQQAEYPEGQAELFKWLSANIQYPIAARENSIIGKVIIRMIVEKDGSLSNIHVLRGTNELLDKEAIRVVQSMPRWKPGKQRGNDVRSYFTLPVVFRLPEDTPSDKK